MSQPIRVNGTGGPVPVPFGMLTARMREFEGDYILADNAWDEIGPDVGGVRREVDPAEPL